MAQRTDTTSQKNDSLRFPIKDRYSDPFSYRSYNPFDLRDTTLIKRDIQYDPLTKQYYIVEKIGNSYFRKPTYLTIDEMVKLQGRKNEVDYFKKRSQTLSLLNRKTLKPKLKVFDKLFDRIFGIGPNGLHVDIKPQGNVDILAGYQGQNIKNPTLPERARKNGGFDFDMNANVNVMANIGDKLKLPINYNTLANFDFENQLKLDYKGMDDEIIKSFEAGNVNFTSKGTLIPSAQSLFGLKTQLQFGKLFVTGVLANQRAQRQSMALQGGAASQRFEKKLDDYEENRHFLLSQYFKNNFNTSMKNLPVVNSQVQILRIEVWLTNRTGVTTETRDIVGLMDLGESTPHNTNINSLTGSTLPQNGANDLYSWLAADPNNRNPALINSRLLARGLRGVEDYEKTFARKLTPNEYYFNPQIGFISLNQQLQPDEVLGVAFQYNYNGKVYQVGEFSQDVTLDSSRGVQKVLFLKLLKATSQRPKLPIWNLMMKNVYSLDVPGIQRQDFKLNLLYEEPSGGLKRFLPETAPIVEGRPLLSLLNLDRLNNQNDPQPDGVFDYVEGFTILPQMGKIIFPTLQPFGKDLDTIAFPNMPIALKKKYVYYQLYDSIKAIAQTYANLNRFVMQGQVKGNSSSEIYLGAFNVPPGSVTVMAGGQILRESSDFIIDYNLGTVKILNQAILNSGLPVNVQFENNAGFGIQQRNFLGLRLDYLASKKLTLGASAVRLGERPFFTKMNYGDDPIKNSMYGVDFSYKSDLPGLTRTLNKLPFYNSTAMSTINAYGEAAVLKPGHPSQIGKGNDGLIYIDDFEGTRNSIDLRFPFISWAMASTPQGNGRFPESTLTDSIDYNKNRAKIAWYNIEPILQDKNSSNNPLKKDLAQLSDPRVRPVSNQELFPQRTPDLGLNQLVTFDLAYYPTDMGPYNFETKPSEIDANGKLKNPKKRWGGIMRNIDQTDFETGNVEFVEFWIQDPFIKKPTSTGGKMYINLGNISEDILKDGRRFYENGLNTPTIPAAIDSSNTWGKTPVNPIQITQAFSNDPNDRVYQDVGFDGLTDDEEHRKRSKYINDLKLNFGANAPITLQALKDPSNDNYKWYRDESYDASNTGILGRYKNFNNPQGNSPVAGTSDQFTPAATLYPDNEDLNRDNTLNETEEYYEYEIDLKPGMNVGATKYLTDKQTIGVTYADGTRANENWFLFRVPISDYVSKTGNIPDFKSIRFMRMYLSDFEDSVVLRFARLDLVRNQWRRFAFNVDTTGSYTPINNSTGTLFNVLAVNVEENSKRQPVNYLIPPGIERVQQLSNNNINILQNEQAMSFRVQDLATGQTRAAFKTLNMDMRQYGRLSMFLHAESIIGATQVLDNELNAVVRIGQDFLNNYYEIKIPLKITKPGNYTTGQEEIVWPPDNNLDFDLQDLISLKTKRNASTNNISKIFREKIGNKTFSIVGNPNLGEVRGILVGVENPYNIDAKIANAEIWVNELRLSKLDEKGGWAALGRVDLTLSDLGNVSVSVNTYTQGFGTIEQRVNERAREDFVQFDAAANIDAGKLLPKKLGLTIPIYASINKTVRTPEYDPYDLDIRLKDKLNSVSGFKRDSINNVALDKTTIKTFNLTNVRFAAGTGKPKIWSLSNFDFSYSYIKMEQTNPLIIKNDVTKYRGGLGYTFNSSPKFWEPFKKKIKSNSPWFALIKDFNLNPKPSLLSFRADINRQFGQFIPRIVNSYDNKVERVDTTYDKYFTFDRFYNLRWDLTKSLNIDFSATNNARVDEPYGLLNTDAKKDTVRSNFWKGGRNTLYNQKAILSYNLPTAKLPLVDWINARYSYTTSYNWIGASRLAISLGNTIENSQDNNVNAEFDFTRLYQKSRWLKALDNPPAPKQPKEKKSDKEKEGPALRENNNSKIEEPKSNLPTKEEVIKGLTGKKKREALKKWRKQKRDERKARRLANFNRPVEMGGLVRTSGKLLTMVKRASINYSENYKSRLPGYNDSTQFFGQNFNSMAPGLDYVFGKQPDTTWLNDKAAKGLISKDSLFNFMFRQNFDQKLSLTAQLEPISELTIDLNLEKSFNKDYTELFKSLKGDGKFEHLSPLAAGGFNVTFIAFNTLFSKHDPNQISETFRKFESNRLILSERLAKLNPYSTGAQTADGFYKGYGRYAQDVLIPSFIAAYTGKDANEVALLNQSNPNIKSNPFSGIKALPNWRLTYTGLTKIKSFAEKFSIISLTHAYTGNLSMNSFTSALLYQDPFRFNAPGFIDSISGNFVPYFLVPNISIQESFSPLFGIDITTTDQLNLKFEYKKSRQISLSLIDFQLSEVKSTEWTIGGSWRKKGFNPGFRLPFSKGKKLENDINFRLDLSMRDDISSNSRLDQNNAFSTGGQKVYTIQPSIDYVLNNRVNITLFFDQRRVIPYISTSAPITNTRAGLKIRISLAQ
jgi:cell surface protein SprA